MPNYYILRSGTNTYNECINKNLFGASQNMEWLVGKIKSGDVLFLSYIATRNEKFNNFIEGPFIAKSNGEFNIDQNAFNGNFPWQVRVDSSNKRSKIYYNDYKTFFESRGLILHDDIFPPQNFDDNTGHGQALLETLGLVYKVESHTNEENERSIESDFRKKFEAKFLCSDGHYVRSLSEQAIDNWLYNHNIFHSYEKKLPIVENVYTDFYLKAIDCYIEFWGLNDDPIYIKRKEIKKRIYGENSYHLIELNFDDLKHLDDILPIRLLNYGLKIT